MDHTARTWDPPSLQGPHMPQGREAVPGGMGLSLGHSITAHLISQTYMGHELHMKLHVYGDLSLNLLLLLLFCGCSPRLRRKGLRGLL